MSDRDVQAAINVFGVVRAMRWPSGDGDGAWKAKYEAMGYRVVVADVDAVIASVRNSTTLPEELEKKGGA